MELRGAGRTDVGMTRKHNEDSMLVDNEAQLYVVADGVGGLSAGEVASRMSVDIIKDYIRHASERESVGERDYTLNEASNTLASAVRLANKVIHDSACKNPALQRMGSTVVAVVEHEGVLSIAHVGDSRAYIIRHKTISQVTDDHSLVMEQVRQGLITEAQARTSSAKNVITRALGAAPDVEVDVDEVAVMPGDKVLLCSDGLTNMVQDKVILSVVENGAGLDESCKRLVELANQNGGKDNITVVIIDVPKKKFFGFLKKILKNT